MESQGLGLALRTGLPVETKRVRLRQPWSWLAPRTAGNPLARLTPESTPLEPPWPRLLIGVGRQSVPVSIAVKRASGGQTVTVQCQHPRVAPGHFDLVVPPEHDGLTGANVFPILGSPNGITPTALARAREEWRPRFASLREPRVAALIGGTSKGYSFTRAEAAHIAEILCGLAGDCGLMVTTSRRTGTANTDVLRQRLAACADFWDGSGANPYPGMLAWADAFLVTADSVNMACEAGATGKPVHVLPLSGGSAKFRRFHRSLELRGVSRPFRGQIERWSYVPLDETGRAAERIRALLDGARQAPDMSA